MTDATEIDQDEFARHEVFALLWGPRHGCRVFSDSFARLAWRADCSKGRGVSLFTLPRRGIALLIATTSFAVGSVLIWQLLNPRVIGSVPTSVLAVAFGLQVLPLVTWVAWRVARLSGTAIAAPVVGRVEAAASHDDGPFSVGRPLASETVHIHRVVRTGPRPGPAKLPAAVR